MSAHQVATPSQAALLLVPDHRPLLNFLMQDARSASEVARHLGVPLARASYLLGKLHRGEVAFVERTEARAGRPVKRYRVLPRWFIPYEVTAADTLEAFSLTQIGPRMERIAAFAAHQMREHQPVWGVWLSQGEEHSDLEIGDARGPAQALFAGDEPLMLTIASLRLAAPQARELKRRMLALLQDCATWEVPDAPQYTVSLMLVRGSVE